MDRGEPAILVVMGVSGAGKTTVGGALARALGWRFLDGDALHSPASIDKMRRGIPLTEADRDPWLERLRQATASYLAAGERAVIACSALKRTHRSRLRVGPGVRFVYLKGGPPLLRERLRHRRGHYMKAPLLESQLATLEEPRDALTLDADLPVDVLVRRVIRAYGLKGERTEAGD